MTERFSNGLVSEFASRAGLEKPPRSLGDPITEESLSDNQQTILDSVKRQPGITIQAMAERMALSHSTCSYHLRRLTRAGFIAQERRGRALHHYPPGANREVGTRIRTVVTDPRKRRVLDSLRNGDHTRLTINALASNLGLPYGFVKRTLCELEREGLVNMTRRNYRYTLEVIKDIDKLLDRTRR